MINFEVNSTKLIRTIIDYLNEKPIGRYLRFPSIYKKDYKFLSVIFKANLLFSFSQEIPKENKTMRTISKFLTVELFVSNYIVITDANDSFLF